MFFVITSYSIHYTKLYDLGDLYPSVSSIAVVPVGLSKFRKNLYPLIPFNEKSANEALELIEQKQSEFLEKYNTRLVFPSDEFFLTSKKDLPDNDYYEEYPQYENGVGLIRALNDEFLSAVSEKKITHINNRNISIVTGKAAHKFLNFLIEKVTEKWHNVNCNVFAIKNDFFGQNITVAGLITGQDLVAQLKDKELGELLLIPSVMIKQGTELFLDDYTITQVENELNIKIITVDNNGYDLLDKILGN